MKSSKIMVPYKDKEVSRFNVTHIKDTQLIVKRNDKWIDEKINKTLVNKLVVGKHSDLTTGIDESIKELEELKSEIQKETERQNSQNQQRWVRTHVYSIGPVSITATVLLVVLIVWKMCTKNEGKGGTSLRVSLDQKETRPMESILRPKRRNRTSRKLMECESGIRSKNLDEEELETGKGKQLTK